MSKSYYFGRQVAYGFILVTLVLATSVILTLLKLDSNSKINDRMNNFRVPIVRESLLVLSGVNQSIGAFRGWLLFNDKSFKDTRLDAWADIDRSMSRLQALAEKAHDLDNLQNFSELASKLEELRKLQSDLENKDLKLKRETIAIASRGHSLFYT